MMPTTYQPVDPTPYLETGAWAATVAGGGCLLIMALLWVAHAHRGFPTWSYIVCPLLSAALLATGLYTLLELTPTRME